MNSPELYLAALFNPCFPALNWQGRFLFHLVDQSEGTLGQTDWLTDRPRQTPGQFEETNMSISEQVQFIFLCLNVVDWLEFVFIFNSSGWRRKLIFDIHVLTVVSTEAASAMVRCFTNNHWGTFLIFLSCSAATSQEDSDHPAEEGEFDGHGFMVNVLVGRFNCPPPPFSNVTIYCRRDNLYLWSDGHAGHLYQQHLHQALPEGSSVGDKSCPVPPC